MRSYRCDPCEMRWWPIHAINSGCPQCGAGMKPSKDEPSEDAQRRFIEIQRAREEIERATRVREEADAYFAAWDERKWREMEDFLRGLPELA